MEKGEGKEGVWAYEEGIKHWNHRWWEIKRRIICKKN